MARLNQPSTLVIGLTGRARNGKTTVANAIYDVFALNYDTRMYDIGAQVLRFCKEQRLIAPMVKREELNREELAILVRVGKEQRDLDQDFWLRMLQDHITQDRPGVVIVPNVRYENEARWIQSKHAGYLLRVTALNHNGSPYISPDRDPNHESETALLTWPVNFFITAYRGQTGALSREAAAIAEYIQSQRSVVTETLPQAAA